MMLFFFLIFVEEFPLQALLFFGSVSFSSSDLTVCSLISDDGKSFPIA